MSGMLLPPLAVLLVGGLLAFLALGSSFPVGSTMPVKAAALHLSPVFTPEVQHWGQAIAVWADQAGLDPDLAATVMQIESCGDPLALSRSGAIGLFQVMPYHFVVGEDPYRPDTNALRGLDYLRRSLAAAEGDVHLALAGYNGGIGIISLPERSWPLQAQRYAYWGSGIYADAASGQVSSPRLQEWLQANGISLCLQANDRLGLTP